MDPSFEERRGGGVRNPKVCVPKMAKSIFLLSVKGTFSHYKIWVQEGGLAQGLGI